MSTVVWGLAAWVGVSALAAVAYGLGAAIGYRRGFEDGRAAAKSPASHRVIRLDDDVPAHVRGVG